MQDPRGMSDEELLTLLGKAPTRQAPAAPQQSDMSSVSDDALLQALGRPARPQRPQRSAPPATPAPPNMAEPPAVAGPTPLTREERIEALFSQYGDMEQAVRLADEQIAYEGGQPSPLAGQGVGGPEPVANYQIPEGVVDYETLTPEAIGQLTRGTRVLLPPDAPGQARQIVTLARDMSAPQRDAILGEQQQTIGGVQTYVPGMADSVGAFASGAAEQVPFLDEGATLADALLSGQSFSEARDDYQMMQDALNRSNRGERVAGGLTGFAGSLALPGAVGIRGLQGMTGAARTAAAAAGAAPVGAAYGFAAGEGSAADRAPGAVIGGLLAGGGTGIVDAGMRFAPNIASGLSEAGAVVSRGFGIEPREAQITDRATESARQYVARLLESSGADLTANLVAALGKPITAAEAIGPSGVSNMAALTRRAGRAGNMAQSQLGARAQEQPNRVIQDFADLTGMDPAGSADMIQNLAAEGRKKAAPLYEAAYARPGAVRSPLIDDVLERPSMRRAMSRAARIAAEEGRDPTTLGFQFDDAGDVIHVREPSMQTLDYVKRGLDDVLNTYRDPVTRRLNLDEEGRAILNTLQSFRDEVIRLNPAYGEALSAGGDPIRLEEAFGQADRLFQVGTSQRAFETATARMGEAERNALVAGFADRLFRNAQSGRLGTRQLGQLNVPVTREKLAALIGPDGADSFIQRVQAEIDLARSGARMAPGTNSITAEATEAMREQDRGVGLFNDLARNIEQSRSVLGGTAMTAAQALTAPVAGFVRGATAPAAQPVRDEIARMLLMPPDDLAALLSQSGDLSRREAQSLAAALQRGSASQGGQDDLSFPPIAPRRAGQGGRQ